MSVAERVGSRPGVGQRQDNAVKAHNWVQRSGLYVHGRRVQIVSLG